MVLDKIINNGVAFAAEAIQHNKNKKKAAAAAAAAEQSSAASSSSQLPSFRPSPGIPPSDSPPPYSSIASSSRQPPQPQEKQQVNEKREHGSSGLDDGDEEELTDEDLWEIDEEAQPSDSEIQQRRAMIPKGLAKDPATISVLVDAFVATHKPIQRNTPAELPAAVIIPQRRPSTRDRGFIRAYAPCLEPCGISQDAFMDFHEFYDEALKYSNIIKVIQVSAGIVGLVPGITTMAVSMAVGAATKVAASVQSRQRTNDFISRMNAQYFIPQGMVCLILKYGGNASGAALGPSSFDMDSAYAKATSQPHRNLRSAQGTMNDNTMPPAAPLIFPNLKTPDGLPEGNKWQRSMRFIREYQDRRAQANFAMDNPESGLSHATEGQLQFESSLGDPRQFSGFQVGRERRDRFNRGSRFQSDSSNSPQDDRFGRRGRRGGGGPIGLALSLATQAYQSRSGNAAPAGSQSGPLTAALNGRGNTQYSSGRRGNVQRGPLGLISTLKKKGVLYMMIVPLPTQEEIDAVPQEVGAYLNTEDVAL